jgi:hypothetical protein
MRDEDVPKAFNFEVAFCGDPKCGLHIRPFSREGQPICEMVLSAKQTLELIEICKSNLYDKATRRV